MAARLVAPRLHPVRRGEVRGRPSIARTVDPSSAAQSFAAEALALDAASFKAHFFLGKLLFKEEKFAESARELEISRDLNPSSSAARFALIRAYNALGKKTEAKREASAFKRLRELEDRFRQSGQVPVYQHGTATVRERNALKPIDAQTRQGTSYLRRNFLLSHTRWQPDL